MQHQPATGYLPGDPRYGLQGEALKAYYRTKAAQWAIYCWDKPGAGARRDLLAEQKAYVAGFGERVIGYGHFVSDDGRDTLGTSFFMQLDDRAAADAFVAAEPMGEPASTSASRSTLVEQKLPEARGRLSPQGPSNVPLHRTQDRHAGVLPETPARARGRTSRRTATTSSSAGRSAPPMASTASAPPCCSSCPTGQRRMRFGTTSRLPGNGGYRGDYRIIRWVFGD